MDAIIRILVIAVLAIAGSGAYLKWAAGPVLVAYEIGKLIGGRRHARETAAR